MTEGIEPQWETKSYVCIHVFEGTRPVLYATRPDGDWCLLCGSEHSENASSYRVVGMNHVIANDDSLRDVLDLQADEEADREFVGGPWTRQQIELN